MHRLKSSSQRDRVREFVTLTQGQNSLFAIPFQNCSMQEGHVSRKKQHILFLYLKLLKQTGKNSDVLN